MSGPGRFGRAALAAACAVCASACALFGKSEPIESQFYSAEARDPVGHEVSAREPGSGVRLGRVVGSSHLREPIAYRSSERELGFYQRRRWTERPEAYFRRALARALFEQRQLTRAVSGVAPTLEVELTDFDELLRPEHKVRVRAHVVLSAQRIAALERTFTVERPVPEGADDEFDRVAAAMADALEGCVSAIGDAVAGELSRLSAEGAGAEAASPDAGVSP